jgi:two-component system chemotaxis response regulator CheB
MSAALPGPPPLVAIGASLGGLHALSEILSRLPRLNCAIAIVQHRDRRAGADLRFVLQHVTPMPVLEAEDKMPIEPGHVYLAPADYHLLVDGRGFALSLDEPVLSSRPSIDVFFESVADTYGPRAVGVLLTGSSRDGASGLARIKRRGGTVVVQDPDTAEAPAMPRAALEETAVDARLELQAIADHIARACPADAGATEAT